MSTRLHTKYHLLRHILHTKPNYVGKYKNILSCTVRYRSNGRDKDLSSFIQPVTVNPANNTDDINVGAELSMDIKKDELLKLLNKFSRQPMVQKLAAENGLDHKLFHQAFMSFRIFCVSSENLPVDLHIVLSDIIQNAGHIDDIFPYFLQHAKEIFPHIDCMEDLQKISDLRLPANWYPEARCIQRKIIIHAGPTNSGKTYHALKRFLTAKSGVYCGPLKLLAAEVFKKSAAAGTPCDLVTGEERRYADKEENPSPHVACTVEMTNVFKPFEVAIIDEIQMIKDPQRGWAWTRALLGVNAQEVHLCGEGSTIDLVRELMMGTGDEVEVRKYKRLTKLTYLDKAVESFDNIRDGDCIVCFSKNDIYHISRQLELRNKEVAVIYGGLPPGTKLAQAEKFNDATDPCKIMVATDAIGMGLNLSIRRIIFYSMIKPYINEKGEKEMDVISTSQALQISGRAGRFGTAFENGEVTTFRNEDIDILKDITSRLIDPLEQAGLHPTAEQIELFAYHLPKASLSNLIDIFVTISTIDNDRYFMCNVDDFKFLADMIEHVPLALRVRYVFCCAPIPKKQPFVCTMFLKFARQFSRNEPLTLVWLCRQIGWPFSPPGVLADLVHLEGVFDVLDLYLWLSYRFPDMFPDVTHIRDMQTELDLVIQEGVKHITSLLKAGESTISTGTQDNEDDFEIKVKNKKPNSRFQREVLATQSVRNKISDSSNKRSRHMRKNFGRVTEKLIKEGLITSDMVNKMQQEWASELKQSEDDGDNSR